jgi:hypothetical protein
LLILFSILLLHLVLCCPQQITLHRFNFSRRMFKLSVRRILPFRPLTFLGKVGENKRLYYFHVTFLRNSVLMVSNRILLCNSKVFSLFKGV